MDHYHMIVGLSYFKKTSFMKYRPETSNTLLPEEQRVRVKRAAHPPLIGMPPSFYMPYIRRIETARYASVRIRAPQINNALEIQ